MADEVFGYATDNDRALEYRRKLGSGGFGTVHEIYDIAEQRLFARKLLHIPSVDERLIRKEVDAIKKLCGLDSHDNIIQVLNHGHLSNPIFYFIDMELCDLNLHDYIHGQRPLTQSQSGSVPHLIDAEGVKSILQIWTVMGQIASGVEYIHRQNQVHRDIKPANVLYSCKSSAWKLADFGLSTEGSSKTNRPTQYGRGTPGYRAPELMESDGEPGTFSNKVDIWSMGCILYELCIGERAFKSDWEVFKYSLSGKSIEIVVDDSFDGQSKAKMVQLITDMLRIEPSERRSALDLSNEFVDYIRQCGMAESKPHGLVQIHSDPTPSAVSCESERISNASGDRQHTRNDQTSSPKFSKHTSLAHHPMEIVPANRLLEEIEEEHMQEDADDTNQPSETAQSPDPKYLVEALLLNSKFGNITEVQSLLEKGVDINGSSDAYDGRNALIIALRFGHESVALLLLQMGADPNSKFRGWNAIHFASSMGLEALVRLLLKKGAKMDARDNSLQTPLICAASNGHEGIVRVLLENGADVNATGDQGTALRIAVRLQHKAMARLLLANGADIDAEGWEGTALWLAVTNGRESMVRLLLEYGADVDAGKREETNLQFAIQRGHETIARLLLEDGANVHVDHWTGSPLRIAVWNGNESMVRLLLLHGADVNRIENLQPHHNLLVAAHREHEAIIRLLLESGANVNAQVDYGNGDGTLLDAARYYGYHELAQVLLEYGAESSSLS